MFPNGESVTIQTPGSTSTDRYGNTTADWSNPTETVVDGVAVAPRHDRENPGDARSAVIVGYQLLMPATASVDAHSRVVVRGEVHEVDGMPGLWRHPMSGWEPGVEVLTRRVEG